IVFAAVCALAKNGTAAIARATVKTPSRRFMPDLLTHAQHPWSAWPMQGHRITGPAPSTTVQTTSLSRGSRTPDYGGIKKCRVHCSRMKPGSCPSDNTLKRRMTQPVSNRRRSVRILGPFDGTRPGLLNLPLQIYDLSVGGCFVNSVLDAPQRGQI